ncbi:hypothetical protein [Chromobacterium haemolyticum]|uniref:Uncharacterized protein n=1 Tax=Chromobacterium haemolyticum TaxID=394935 RepID=A0A1W0D1X0_9NEIS|nr:hypothetical protein [Chromobacterium haemolyticum]OQS41009.1 hypothetical protein B0T45_09245 [Chromobacterium haemolyticum]
MEKSTAEFSEIMTVFKTGEELFEAFGRYNPAFERFISEPEGAIFFTKANRIAAWKQFSEMSEDELLNARFLIESRLQEIRQSVPQTNIMVM